LSLLLAACTVNLRQIQQPGSARAVTTTGPWNSMIYAARTDSGVVVIDLGWIGAGRGLRSAIAALEATPADVTHVFLTHSHRDHIAGWPLLRPATFHVGGAEAALFRGAEEHADFASGVAEWLLGTSSPREGELRVAAFSSDTAFALGTDTLRAFLVPGHTDGSAAYLFRGVLFVGDAVSHTPIGGFHAAQRIYSEDVGQGKRSLEDLWERVAPYRVEWVCTAHGKCARWSKDFREKAVR
jgi:glyoxylase-like metal-dependent hydrolase (beta-lactamase superfamily II)